MEVHAHSHTPRKKWTHYLWEFLMLFLAVFAGFLAENRREHIVEKKRAHQFLESMLLDVRTNIKNLDSLLSEDNIYVKKYDSLMNWLLQDSATIDRAAFARQMGAVWVRNFLVRKETYEQMKSSGSLRYVGNIDFLKKMMDYERITNFAQYMILPAKRPQSGRPRRTGLPPNPGATWKHRWHSWPQMRSFSQRERLPLARRMG